MDFFNSRIHHWYAISKRDLPWRNSTNPYFIWLSEIILQQTRIDQGLGYYLRFIDEFPSINELANAKEDEVLKLWQGLGYYSRARNLLFSAKYIQEHYQGKFPADYDSIRLLKGIGDYTTTAIATNSFYPEFPAVDGNVYRLLSRFFGIQQPIDSISGKKVFQTLAKELIKGTDPGMHNQALMEFGALQCTPRNPDCSRCPLNEQCFALASGTIGKLPVKEKKTRQKDRYFNYLVFEYNNDTWMHQRSKNDIWKGLFEFPMEETLEKTEVDYLLKNTKWTYSFNNSSIIIRNVSNWKIHLLSHQRIHYRFISFSLLGEIEMPAELIRVNKEDILSFAIPRLLEPFLNDFVKTR